MNAVKATSTTETCVRNVEDGIRRLAYSIDVVSSAVDLCLSGAANPENEETNLEILMKLRMSYRERHWGALSIFTTRN